VRRAGQQRVALEDRHVRFRQHHLDIVEQRREEGPVARHFSDALLAVPPDRYNQRGADAVPAVNPARFWLQANTQGIARRLSTPPLSPRRDGREPIRSRSITSIGVAARK
jgi:hypothetical protein